MLVATRPIGVFTLTIYARVFFISMRLFVVSKVWTLQMQYNVENTCIKKYVRQANLNEISLKCQKDQET